MTTPQSSAAAPALPKSVTPVAAATAALAKEMAAEASKAGVSIGAGMSDGGGAAAKPPPWERDDEPADAAATGDDDSDDGDNASDGATDSATPAPATAGKDAAELSLSADIQAALAEKDPEALGKALGGVDLFEIMKIKPDDYKALRHDRKKANTAKTEAVAAIENMTALEVKLREKYSDPTTARKAFQGGDLDTFFDTVTKWSGVPYVEVQKAWAMHVQGKPVPPLKFRDPDADAREEQAKQAETTKAADAEKKAGAMTWIAEGIKGDKLAAEPGIADRVFEKLRVKWNDGVRTPAKALELVKADIVEENRAQRARLKAAGLLPKKTEEHTPRGHGHSPSKVASVTTATRSNGKTDRKMTDAELAADVLANLPRETWRK